MSTITGEFTKEQLIEKLQHRVAVTANYPDVEEAQLDASIFKIALASLEAEAVAYTEKCEITNMQATGLYLRGFPDNSQGRDIALYTALPAPVSVPDELKEFLRLVECMLVDYRESNLGNAREWIRHISSASDAFEDAHSLSPWLWVRTGRRAAMLQAEAGNSPVIPDGWVACSERMPEEGDDMIVFTDEIVMSGVSYSKKKGFYLQALEYDDDEPVDNVTHWMPLPSAPQQEVE